MKDTLISYDPSSGEVVGNVSITPVADIAGIVAKAKIAQQQWRKLSVDQRISYLAKGTSKASEQSHELTELLAKEMGKDYRRASGEVSGATYGAMHIAEEAKNATMPISASGTTIEYGALGVVAVISPWNYPLMMAVNLMIPALVAGNTVVFKPSEETPLIAQKYVEILNEFLPEDVLQIIHGDGKQGQALVEADVNMIAFTGSQAVGKDIMQRAANGVKRLVMELGGNDPMIVLDDANIDNAARFAVASSFENAGQMCTSTERIYVDETVAEQFQKRVVEIASQYRYGAWHETGVNYGPIINAKQRDNIINHIEDAKQKGATVLLGGENHPEYYITPTVLSGIKKDMLMEQQETFGPVVSISTFNTVDEAIQRANSSTYGLGAVVFGTVKAKEVAQDLEAGMIGVNKGPGSDSGPWVGAKQSGFGYHGTADGHRQFTQVRVIS